jgi:peptidoglycan/xylan/chitin deacetylase (PgdA/CDA1 family)
MLRRGLRELRRRSAGYAEGRRTARLRRGAILLYHRVAEPDADPWGMAVSPANFVEHLAVLRRYGTPRTVTGFARHLDEAGEADCSVAVTLDDGYADTLQCALPLLEAAQVPATVYVVADAIGDPAAFWWDRLSEILLARPDLPDTPCPAVPPGYGLEADRAPGEEAECRGAALVRNRGWSADEEEPATRRQRLFLAAWRHVASLGPADRRRVVAELCAWAGVSPEAPDAESRPMTPTELRRLADSPLIEIGGHTATHADLSALSDDCALEEIARGRELLAALSGQAVSSFAYPFGRAGPRTPELVRAAGFSSATCSRFGVATSRSDRFLLPRLHVCNCSGVALERMLAATLGRRPAGRLTSPADANHRVSSLAAAWDPRAHTPASTGDPPLVTVIVPAFNAAATLDSTLASISAQTYPRLEILVVDDGSIDDTAAIVRKVGAQDRRIRLLEQANAGVARARNAALAEARGEYAAWIDADDLWHPEKIARQLAAFAAAPEPPSFVYTGYRLIDEDDIILQNYRPLTDVSGYTLCRQIATNFFSNVSSIMVPTELARAVGGHDPRLREEGIEGAEDLLMQLRLAAIGPAACCTAALVGYRMHHASMSNDHYRAACSNLRALELVAQEQPLVPEDVLKLGRARVVGYVPNLVSDGRIAAGWRLLAKLAGQPLWLAEMMCRMAVLGLCLMARSHDCDPAIGQRFLEANPDTACWSGHMLLPARRKAWLDACDARLQQEQAASGQRGAAARRVRRVHT